MPRCCLSPLDAEDSCVRPPLPRTRTALPGSLADELPGLSSQLVLGGPLYGSQSFATAWFTYRFGACPYSAGDADKPTTFTMTSLSISRPRTRPLLVNTYGT